MAGPLNRRVIADLVRHRGYIWRTAWGEVRTRYAGSGLGALWNVIQPLSLILIFTLVFGGLMPARALQAADGRPVPYVVYLCAAMLPWSALADCVTRGTHAFVHHAAYLRKLPIPEQVFAAQTALASLIGLTIAFTLLVVVALAVGHPPSWRWLLVPAPMLMLVGFGFGVGLALGTLNAFIRDVGQGVPIVLGVAFWLYPIVYVEETLPPGLRSALAYNPVAPFLSAIRDLFVWDRLPPAGSWAMMTLWTGLAIAGGMLVLRRLRGELRDVL